MSSILSKDFMGQGLSSVKSDHNDIIIKKRLAAIKFDQARLEAQENKLKQRRLAAWKREAKKEEEEKKGLRKEAIDNAVSDIGSIALETMSHISSVDTFTKAYDCCKDAFRNAASESIKYIEDKVRLIQEALKPAFECCSKNLNTAYSDLKSGFNDLAETTFEKVKSYSPKRLIQSALCCSFMDAASSSEVKDGGCDEPPVCEHNPYSKYPVALRGLRYEYA